MIPPSTRSQGVIFDISICPIPLHPIITNTPHKYLLNHPLMFISNVTPSVQANILADLDDHNNLMTLLYPLLPSNNLSLYQAEKFYSNANSIMLLLCLKPFCDLLTPLGAVESMGLQVKTINYVLVMLSLKCLLEIRLRSSGQMYVELTAGDITRVLAAVTENHIEIL